MAKERLQKIRLLSSIRAVSERSFFFPAWTSIQNCIDATDKPFFSFSFSLSYYYNMRPARVQVSSSRYGKYHIYNPYDRYLRQSLMSTLERKDLKVELITFGIIDTLDQKEILIKEGSCVEDNQKKKKEQKKLTSYSYRPKYKVDIARDSGETVGSRNPNAYFCLFFAKGMCTQGPRCNMWHRIPRTDDVFETTIDCFGRDKFT